MTPVIPEPQLRNPLIRLGVAVSERIIGRRLATARLLAWSPKVAAGAGALEALAPTAGRDLPERTLRLARLTASLTLNCPFCIDMNAHRHRQVGITDAEVYALRDRREDVTKSFSPSERLVIAYARGMSTTPITVDDEVRQVMAAAFSERRLVELTAAIAAVNLWARFAQGLGVDPAGFGDHCLVDTPLITGSPGDTASVGTGAERTDPLTTPPTEEREATAGGQGAE